MDLRELETFLVLAEELHFTRTAQRLYLTPGRVTQIVQALEREVGAPLFERSSRRVALTPLGERFRDSARLGVDQLQAALREAQASARGIEEVLRVGYQFSIGSDRAMRLTAAFETRHPSCAVQLRTLTETFDFSALRDGEVDVLVTWSPGGSAGAAVGDDLTAGPVLGTEARAVVVAADHPLAGRSSITTDDVVGYNVRRPGPGPSGFVEAWAPRRTSGGQSLEYVDLDQDVMSAFDLLSRIARSRLVHFTLVSILERYPHDGVVVVPVTDLPPAVIVPLWRTSAENATIRAFAEVAASLGG